MAEPITDLERAFLALRARSAFGDKYWAYYDGNTPTVYSTKKMREIFGNIKATWRENWCAVVADSAHERINLARFSVGGTAAGTDAAKPLNDLWEAAEMSLDDDDAHLAALVCGESYVIVWKDGDAPIEAYYNDPRMCWMCYESERPKVKRFAAKWWIGDEDGKRYLKLYYPEKVQLWASVNKSSSSLTGKPGQFVMVEDDPNPFGEIPVFHLRLERRVTKSALINAIELQDAVNKLFADMMISSEFASMRQRWIVSNLDDGQASVDASAKIVVFPAGDSEQEPTQVGEFEAADLEKFTKTMDKIVSDLAIITRTPKHYFFGQNGDPSGEALIAMESPLIKKVEKYIERFIPVWQEIAAFMMRINGTPIEKKLITPVFDSPQTVQPRTRAEITEIRTRSGIPLRTVLEREEGWSESEVTEMEKEQAKEAKANADAFAAKASAAGTMFDAGKVA